MTDASGMSPDASSPARRKAVLLVHSVLLSIGLLLGPAFSRPASADCAMQSAAEAIETAEVVFIGIPVEPVGEPADDGFGGAQLWRFDVLEVAKGTVGPETLVVYDNWYASLTESATGSEVVVIASEWEEELHAAGCVERMSPEQLRADVEVLGLELLEPDPDVSAGTAPAPEDGEEPDENGIVAEPESTETTTEQQPTDGSTETDLTDDESSQSDSNGSNGTLRAVGILGGLLLAGGAVFAYTRRS